MAQNSRSQSLHPVYVYLSIFVPSYSIRSARHVPYSRCRWGSGVFQSRCLLHAVIVWFVPGGGGPAIALSPKGRMWWPIFATVSTHFPSPFRVFEFGWFNLLQGNSNQLVFLPMDLWDSIRLGCLIFSKETEVSLLGWYPVCVFSPTGFWDSVSLGCSIFFKETEISLLGWYPVCVFFPMGFVRLKSDCLLCCGADLKWWLMMVVVQYSVVSKQENSSYWTLVNHAEASRD